MVPLLRYPTIQASGGFFTRFSIAIGFGVTSNWGRCQSQKHPTFLHCARFAMRQVTAGNNRLLAARDLTLLPTMPITTEGVC
jgi:hypothetical protein